MGGVFTDASTLGGAFRGKLGDTLDGSDAVFCRVRNPVSRAVDLDSHDAWDWYPHLNYGDEWEPFCQYDFGKESEKTGGSTGDHWVTDRILELEDGSYRARLTEPDQLEMIEQRLQQGNHGGCTNALVAQVFQVHDLEAATRGPPNQQGVACLTQLQFKPVQDRLHCYQTMRSQWVDLKGYGNLVAAAVLLSRMCARTGYKPGQLYESVHNAITWNSRHANQVWGIL